MTTPDSSPRLVAKVILLFCQIGCMLSLPMLFTGATTAQAIDLNHRAQLLHWVPSFNNRCGGYFPDTLARNAFKQHHNQDPIRLTVQKKSYIVWHSHATLHAVSLKQGQQTLQADVAHLSQNSVTGKERLQTIQLLGHSHYQSPGYRAIARQMTFEPQENRLALHHFWFRIASSLNHWIWGHAVHGVKQRNGMVQLEQAQVSVCSPLKNSWYIQAQHILLDTQKGIGYAHGAHIIFHHIPIVYFPYVTFPLNKHRKSGFLTPSLSHRAHDGWVVTTPFYWNIASNKDLLMTPHWIQKRGGLLDTVFRYLTPHSSGTWHGMWLPHDRLFTHQKQSAARATLHTYDAFTLRQLARLTHSSSQRIAMSLDHHSIWNPHWTFNLHLHTVSDDYFYLDFFPHADFYQNTQRLNQVSLTYQDTHWRFLAHMQSYQILHPMHSLPLPEVYDLWPRLSLLGHFKQAHEPIYYNLKAEYTHFNHGVSLTTGRQPTTGDRIYLHVTAQSPQHLWSGLITPEIVVTDTHYDVSHVTQNRHRDRFIPIVDLDAHWHFVRHVTWLRQDYDQTLEPHLFYLWIPVCKQDSIPLWDTTIFPPSFSDLFVSTRLTGIDRLIDANQLTLGVTTRLFESRTPHELLRFSTGYVVSFKRPYSHSATHDAPWITELHYAISPRWETRAAMVWNTTQDHLQSAHCNVSFHKDTASQISLTYHFLHTTRVMAPLLDPAQRASVHHISLAIQWPLLPTLHFMGNIDYNIKQHRTEQLTYSLNYESCCWALTCGAEQRFNVLTPSAQQHTYFLKFQLKGLGDT